MKERLMQFTTLRAVNSVLSVLIVAICLYVATTPFLPELVFWTKGTLNIQPALVKAGNNSQPDTYPDTNTLVIPGINLQEAVHEGGSEAVLTKGVWHRPHTSSPPRGGNTVLAGHRFTYNDPAVFYHLDKVKVGDEIILYWNKQKYLYKVSTVNETPPTATEIEEPSAEPRLTLYTCTPLWSSKHRLVITANLIEAHK